MLNKYSIGKYYLTDSLVHGLNPILKILSTILILVSLIFLNSYIDLALLSLYLIVVMLYSNISIKIYLKNISTLKIFIIFIIIIDIIFFRGINQIVFDVYKIVYIVLYTAVLTLTTPPTEITYGIERILKIFNKIIPVNKIALTLTLALRYIPMLTDQANRIIKAQTLRGINFNSKNIKEKIMAISIMFVPMFTISLQKADIMADIMSVRLYGYSKSRTNYRLNKWNIKNTLILILNVIILSLVIIY